MTHHLITLMICTPLLGALLQAVISGSSRLGPQLSSWISLGSSLASSICGLFLAITMQGVTPELQQMESIPWVGSFSISYELGVDGLNVLPILLISIIFPLLIASEWTRNIGAKGMNGLLLILQCSLIGTVCAQDLFLLFFFWGLSALPIYFLIGIWGGAERETAAFRTIVTSSIGNAFLFAALVLIYHTADPHTFSLQELSGGRFSGQFIELFGAKIAVAELAFGLICAGLALRVPIWPIHGWFTKSAEEAPASVFVVLSAVIVPVGIYIFLRLGYSIFPETILKFASIIVIVGAINQVFGGVCALAQKRLNLVIAFMAISQFGSVLVGVGSLSAPGLVGAIYQCFSLGLAIAAFGLFIGALTSRGGSSEYQTTNGDYLYGGVAIRAPLMAVVAGASIASFLGLPGTSGFIGQALMVVGSYSVHPFVVVLALVCLLLAAYYLFTMYRFIFLGEEKKGSKPVEDLNPWERAYLFPLIICLLIFGLYPKPLIDLVRPTVLTILSTVH